MDQYFCNICGAPRLIEAKFCRKCGAAFSYRIAEKVLSDEDDLDDIQMAEKYINDAVPENYKELTIEQLSRHIVRFLWKRHQGIDPYPSTQELIERDQEHERQMQGFIERNEPPPLCLQAPRSMRDGSLNKFVKPYHLVWVNGMLSHIDLVPQEVGDMQRQVEKYFYKIEPCDCDKVKYIPCETNPNFLRRA